MSYHIVNIDSPRCRITCSKGQLVCIDETGPKRQLPIEDIAAIVITSFSAELHSQLLLESARHNVALIICERFNPISLLLPANRSSDTLLTKASLSLPAKTRDRLWKNTVQAKCENQLAIARTWQVDQEGLGKLERAVRRPTAPHVKETTCARYYWRLFAQATSDIGFRRCRDSEGMNELLNYGYAVLLSLTLQKLFACGLDPTFGIAHEIRERSTPLAYDLMEPFRPVVDARVQRWFTEETAPSEARVNARFRRFVTDFIAEKVGYFELEMPFRNCLEEVVRSFRKATISQRVRDYRPWTLKNSRWVG